MASVWLDHQKDSLYVEIGKACTRFALLAPADWSDWLHRPEVTGMEAGLLGARTPRRLPEGEQPPLMAALVRLAFAHWSFTLSRLLFVASS